MKLRHYASQTHVLFIIAAVAFSPLLAAVPIILPIAHATICDAGAVYNGTECIIFLTSGTSWTVPDDWDSTNNSIEAIGPGGNGGYGDTEDDGGGGGGGGGGAYAKIIGFSATPGDSIPVQIPAGGSGEPTQFSDASTLVADYGRNGGSSHAGSGGAGGATANSIGSTLFAGGAGGKGGSSSGFGGGGGAAGPNGNGMAGGYDNRDGDGSGGGGGADGGSATAGSNASTQGDGGDGGTGTSGASGGSGSSESSGNSAAGGAGNNGSGGGGSGLSGEGADSGDGGTGGNGTEWDATHGAGGGGGSGYGDDDSGDGGGGGTYGGGGGGSGSTYEGSAGTGGSGGQGLIVITYTAASAPAGPAITMTATTATDASSTPVEYDFTYSACGVDPGTGGADSGWQTSATYTDTGLDVNKCYGYAITTRDSAPTPNYTATSSVAEVYTFANTPGSPSLSGQTESTANIANDANGNPGNTLFAIKVTASSPADSAWNGMYVDASGNPSATPVWQTDAAWDATTMTGLQSGTQYTIEAQAENGDGIATAWSDSGEAATVKYIPKSVVLFGDTVLFGGTLY